MTEKFCRVCGGGLFSTPLIGYENMPKSAQFFPDINDVNDEKGTALSVCQCSACGLIQLDNDAVFYYREVIRAAAVSAEMTAFRTKQFCDWTSRFGLKDKKILEVGAGAGEYMQIMREFSENVFGLEQRQASVTSALQKNLDVQQGFIEEVSLNEAPFDAFYMLNFLEHLPNPNASLQAINQALKNDAIGLVEVPNFDMIIRQKLYSEFISDHLFYFTKESFEFTLEKNGFEVIECTETWHDYSLSAVIKKRSPLDLSVFTQQKSIISNELNDYIASFKPLKVAIWGAGHQSLAVMSLADLGEKVRYVIDSASFKQNKFTPATHLPIVEPERLNKDPVEAVIVMAASYSDEVAKIVDSQYPNVNIAVLREDGLEIVKALTKD